MRVKTEPYYLYTRQELENSPTRKDGIDSEKEKQWRRQYVKFICEAAQHLKMPAFVVPTTAILCHRFFAVRSMKRNDKFIIATACLFLSGKVDDCPRPLNEVIRVFFNLRYKNNEQYRARLKDPNFLEEFREQVLTAERAVLYAVGFNFNVEQPHSYSIKLLQQLNVLGLAPPGHSSSPLLAKLPQITTNFVNDSLRNTLTLQYKAETLAKGAIYVAAKLLKLKLPQFEKATFCETWNISQQELDDINAQLLDLYEQPAKPAPVALPLPPPPSHVTSTANKQHNVGKGDTTISSYGAAQGVGSTADDTQLPDSPTKRGDPQEQGLLTSVKAEPDVKAELSEADVKQELASVKEEALEEGELEDELMNGDVAACEADQTASQKQLEDSANEDGFPPNATCQSASPTTAKVCEGFEETSQIKIKASSSPVNVVKVGVKRPLCDAYMNESSPAKKRSPTSTKLENLVKPPVKAGIVLADHDPFA